MAIPLQEHVHNALARQQPEWKAARMNGGAEGGWTRVTTNRMTATVRLSKLVCPRKNGTMHEGTRHSFLEDGDWQEEPTIVIVENSGKVTCSHCREILGMVEL